MMRGYPRKWLVICMWEIIFYQYVFFQGFLLFLYSFWRGNLSISCEWNCRWHIWRKEKCNNWTSWFRCIDRCSCLARVRTRWFFYLLIGRLVIACRMQKCILIGCRGLGRESACACVYMKIWKLWTCGTTMEPKNFHLIARYSSAFCC